MSKINTQTRRAFRENPTTEALAMDRWMFGQMVGGRPGDHLAARPGAFGMLFAVPPPLVFDADQVDDGVAVICVEGPLEHHSSWLWHNYEDLAAEAERAMQHESVSCVVLKIDSPGGLCAGMGECHRQLRAMSERYGKPLYAYVNEQACSAAYHLASACSEIWLPEAGLVGSIGVILCTVDETAALEDAGVSVKYVVTGKRKADMHPGQPVTDEVLRVAQEKVDYLGELFFAAVGSARGMAPAAVEGLEAAVYHGPEAVRTGLADGVAGWAKFLGYVKAEIRGTAVPDSATGRAPNVAHPGKASAMKKRLQLQADYEAATKAVVAARKALARSPDDKKAMAALESALRAKIEASEALSKVEAKTTTTRHVKHEEKTVEREEDEPEETEDEEAQDAPASEDSVTDMPDDEDDEEEAALAKGFAAADRAFRAEVKGSPGLGMYSPERLRRLCAQVTGAHGVRGVFGGIDGVGQRMESMAKTEARLERLESESRAVKVDRLLERAKAAGKLIGKAHVDDMRAQGMQHGADWLEARVNAMPKVARTTADGERAARTDGEGHAVGAPTNSDQEKILSAAMAGLPPEEREKFKAEFEKAQRSRANGSTPTH